jgi:hypothetical protein
MRMTKRLRICLALVAVAVAAGPAAAAIPVSFDTVDAVEIVDAGGSAGQQVKVTGIVTGAGTPTIVLFSFGSKGDAAARCERMATIAMAKPGKFRLTVSAESSSTVVGCKLTAITP